MTVETYLATLGSTLETDAKAQLSTFLGSFVTDDLGKMAIDAVNFAEAELEGSSGAAKQEAAKTQLLNDAEAAGKDLSTASASFLNFLIETALQAVAAGAVAAL